MTSNNSLDITKAGDTSTLNTASNTNHSSTSPSSSVLMDGPYPWRNLKLNKEDAAGFWIRFAAHLIDGLIVLVLFSLIYGVFALFIGFSNDFDDDTVGILIGSALLFWFYVSPITLFPAYYAYFESSKKAATPGKQIVGIVVINKHAGRLGFWPAFGKCCLKNLSLAFIPFIFLVCVFTDKKQALHDLALGCFVVNKRSLLNIYTYNYPFLVVNNFQFANALLNKEELNYLKTTQQDITSNQQPITQNQGNQSVPPSIVM